MIFDAIFIVITIDFTSRLTNVIKNLESFFVEKKLIQLIKLLKKNTFPVVLVNRFKNYKDIIKIGHLNVNSLRNKFTPVEELIKDNKNWN